MSRKEHPKAVRRQDADPDNALFMRRFEKFMRWFGRKEKSEANIVIFDGNDWVFVGRRGLLSNGRKP